MVVAVDYSSIWWPETPSNQVIALFFLPPLALDSFEPDGEILMLL